MTPVHENILVGESCAGVQNESSPEAMEDESLIFENSPAISQTPKETSNESMEDEPFLIEHSDTIPENKFPSGRVICDMEFVLTQARKLERHSLDCHFNGEMIFDKVTPRGLRHIYYFICNQKLCGHTQTIYTDKEKTLNQLAVLGAMSIGSGFSQEEQLFSIMKMSYMCKKTYSHCENTL